MPESHGLGGRVERLVSPSPTQNREPKKATGRAGRNLPWATAIGVGLLALVALILFLPQPFFVVLVAVVVVMALYELAGAFARAGIHIVLPPLWVGSVGILVCAWHLGLEAMFISLFLTLLASIAWRLMDGRSMLALRDALVSALAALYVPFQAGFAVLIYIHGGARAAAIFIVGTIANDLGGYIAGVLAGKHPLAPSVSPSKSWEGFAGSAVMSMVVVGVGLWLVAGKPLLGVAVGLASAVLATVGDLGESLIKRDLGLKDMGSLLPGHGGIMDRLDSLLVTAPLYYVMFRMALGW